MTTIISHIILWVLVPEKPPQELIETYIKGFIESPDKAYKQLKKALPDIEAVIEKIIKLRIEGHKRLYKPNAVTKTGTKIKDSLTPTRAELVRQAKLWLKKTKHAYRHGGKEYLAVIKWMADYYGKTMLPTLAIKGYHDKIRGVGPIAAQWLTAVLTVLKKIKRKEIIEGEPIDITKRGQASKFRNRFNSQIVSVGKPIIEKKDQPGEIIYGNEQINRLVTAFASNKFVPFTPGGFSHIDFIREKGQLFLDIQVSIK